VPLGHHAGMVLSVGGSCAYFARNAHCTVTTELLVRYSNTQNDFFPGAAIFSLHTRTRASPSGRNVNYDEKRTGEKNFSVVPSICTGFVNTCPTIFLTMKFVITEYIIKRPVYLGKRPDTAVGVVIRLCIGRSTNRNSNAGRAGKLISPPLDYSSALNLT
jgi:hypothetical protein